MTWVSSFVLFLHLQFPPVHGKKCVLISAILFGRRYWSSSCAITLTAFPFIYQSVVWQWFSSMDSKSHTLRAVKQHFWGGNYFEMNRFLITCISCLWSHTKSCIVMQTYAHCIDLFVLFFYILYLPRPPAKDLSNSGKHEVCSSNPRRCQRKRWSSWLAH